MSIESGQAEQGGRSNVERIQELERDVDFVKGQIAKEEAEQWDRYTSSYKTQEAFDSAKQDSLDYMRKDLAKREERLSALRG